MIQQIQYKPKAKLHKILVKNLMEKTPSRQRSRQGYNIKITVTGEGTDVSRSGQPLVKTATPTKGWKNNDQPSIYQLLKQDVILVQNQ